MSVPYINIHTHRLPDYYDGIAEDNRQIIFLNCDYSDEIEDKDISVTPIYNNKPTDTNNQNLRNIYYSVGIHPWSSISAVNDEGFTTDCIKAMQQKLSMESVALIGESGLDSLRGANLEVQRQLFIHQIQLSETFHKPMIIHCVKAFPELLEIRKSTGASQLWIIHGYRNKNEQARQLMQNGIQISFGPRFNEGAMKLAWEKGMMWLETDESECPIQEMYRIASECLEVPIEQIKEQIIKQACQWLKINC